MLGYFAAFLLFYALGSHEDDHRKVIAACAFALVAGAIGTSRARRRWSTSTSARSPSSSARPSWARRPPRARARRAEHDCARRRLAVAEERARIARELHDVVAHGVSVIAIQADAAEAALERDPALAQAPLHAIRASAAEALGDMRRLLGVLREEEDGNEITPQPGLAQLEPLLERAGRRRASSHAHAAGKPRALPASLDLVRLPDPAGGADQRPQARGGAPTA